MSRVTATPVVTTEIQVTMDVATAQWLSGYLLNNPFHAPANEHYRESLEHALNVALKAAAPPTPAVQPLPQPTKEPTHAG